MKKILDNKIVLTIIFILLIGMIVTCVIVRKTYKENNNNNNKLDKTQLAIQINSIINFKDSNSDGDFYIKNPDNNIYNIVVKVYLENNKKLIYESKTLKPGAEIKNDKLNTKLKKGKYKAIAYFEAYDDEGTYAGKSGVKLTVVINK